MAGIAPTEFARHGGRLSVAQSMFTQAPQPWLDLSTGINPRSYPAPRASAVARNRLPDVRELARLEALAASAFSVPDAARIAAVGGTECALRLLPPVLGLRRVVIAGPTYGSHADAWSRANCEVHIVADAALDSAVASDTALIVVNPNNPDGRVLSPARLLLLHDSFLRRGGKLIVDESFAEVTPEASVCGLAGGETAEGLIVLRSFGKFYGLAGVRLGFVIAAPSTIAAIRHLLGDWPVSSDALVAGLAAYADPKWAEQTRARLLEDAARLDGLLIRNGFDVVGGTSLFRLARAADASDRFIQLASAGVLVRPFAHDATLLRFGLPGGRSAWQRVASALRLRK